MVQRGRWSGKHVQPLLVKGSENKGFSDGCAFEMELKEWVGFRDKKKRNTKGLRLRILEGQVGSLPWSACLFLQ
jgi:hypothetical protein